VKQFEEVALEMKFAQSSLADDADIGPTEETAAGKSDAELPEQAPDEGRHVHFAADTKEEESPLPIPQKPFRRSKKKQRQQRANFGFEEQLPSDETLLEEGSPDQSSPLAVAGDKPDDDESQTKKKGKKGRGRRRAKSGADRRNNGADDQATSTGVINAANSDPRRRRKGRQCLPRPSVPSDSEFTGKAATACSTSGPEARLCMRCSASFPSRSKLFKHLTENPSHAATKH
jgi:hypothetical protein